MFDGPRLRKVSLGAMLFATVAASLWPVDEAVPRAPRTARSTKPPVGILEAHKAALETDKAGEAVDVDPFAPRSWQADSMPAPVAELPAATPPVPFVGPLPPPPPVPPPALPYQFMGRLGDEGAPVVFLTRGDQTIVARTGDTLELTYKVLSMSASQIEFLHLPTGVKQLMTLPVPGN